MKNVKDGAITLHEKEEIKQQAKKIAKSTSSAIKIFKTIRIDKNTIVACSTKKRFDSLMKASREQALENVIQHFKSLGHVVATDNLVINVDKIIQVIPYDLQIINYKNLIQKITKKL